MIRFKNVKALVRSFQHCPVMVKFHEVPLTALFVVSGVRYKVHHHCGRAGKEVLSEEHSPQRG